MIYLPFKTDPTVWQKKVTQGQFFRNTDLSQNDAHILQIISTNAQLAAASRFSKKILSSFRIFLDKYHLHPKENKVKINLYRSFPRSVNFPAMLVYLLNTFRMRLIPNRVSRGLDHNRFRQNCVQSPKSSPPPTFLFLAA